MQSYSKGSTNVTYKYDENGLRTSKIVNGVQYDYYYVGDKLIYEKKGDEYDLFYRYDADGRLALVEKRRLSDNYRWYYYVVTNSRGDVLEIHNGPGELTAKYTYDSWGKLISITDASGAALSTSSFAYQISVRYRGYVYDSETGLYYLQSRYYDPETGRFLNADDVDCIGTSGTEAGYNAFAYCENEPISRYDPNGFKYSPAKAKKYADKWWDSYNPAYKKNKSDCANFVSQCLYAGGLSKMTGTGKSGWHNQWEHYWYIPTYSYISGKPVMTGFNGKKMKISDAWGKASELYKWLKNNKHIKETTTLNNKKDVTNLVKKLVKNKNTKPCIAAIFFIRDGKIHHAALSGYIESNKKKKEYDIYFYGHTSARCGKKIKYYDKRGNAYYSSLARSFKTEDKYYFCILK